VKAAVWHQKRDVRIDSTAEPGRIGADEAIVEVALCGICGTDVHEYTDGPIFLPHDESGARGPAILGHEFAGTVREVGADVSQARPGDRVTILPTNSCQQCAYCRQGLTQLCDKARWLGLGVEWGGLARHAVAKGYQLFPIPDAVSFEQAAMVEPAAVTLFGVQRGGIKPGDVVLITGGGPIGQLAALATRAVGAREVYLSEVVPGRREGAARNVEPTRVFDPSAESVPDAVRAATGGLGADVAIEASGNERALMDALAAVRKDGTVVQVAIHPQPVSIHPATQLTIPMKRIIGSLSYTADTYRQVIQLMADGKLPVERLVTATIPLQDLVELGLDELGRPDTKHIKILVNPAGS
jgi:(R,R)-butanediol dehydrogenase/meso-butanediol dehydrogenase/diacetyl reductase